MHRHADGPAALLAPVPKVALFLLSAAYVAERRALLHAGMPVAELITAMTARPARLVEGDQADFGVVAPGKVADLVLVEGDPLQEPAALDRVALVVRRRQVVKVVAGATAAAP